MPKVTPDTAMAKAFEAAGFTDPSEKIRSLIRAAMGRTNDNTSQIYSQVVPTISNDLALLLVFTQDYLRLAFNDWLKKERDAIAIELAKIQRRGKSSVSGQTTPELHGRHAPDGGQGTSRALANNSVGRSDSETQTTTSSNAKAGVGSSYSSPRLVTAGQTRQIAFREARAQAECIVNYLDTFIIDGTRLRNVYVRDAREWVRKHRKAVGPICRDTHFVANLCANRNGNELIGDAWTTLEVADLYRKAEVEYASWN